MGRGMHHATRERLDAAIEILAEIQPATVRAVCYRLFTAGLLASMGKSHTNRVSDLLARARERGEIEWQWIVDETRRPERADQWDNPRQIWEAAVRGYRLDYWNDQPRRVEILSEKGTVRGTIAPVLNELGVTFRVLHGYGSATTVHDIADDIADAGRPTHLLYIGDYDPSGMHMSEVDLPGRLDRYGARNVSLNRIALTASDTSGLPEFNADAKAGDPRYRWFREHYGPLCVELDAMDPRALRERVREAITALIDRDAWDHCMAVEKVQRESMTGFLCAIRSTFDRGNSISWQDPK
ncbi:hypothetical protein [Paraburkholderia sp. BR13444]|uniref:hypothetical protein n=1 Tax=Paraburkholderia sp. BR13444 TaxID=3236997 RepID=UPI0034CFE0A2